MRSAILILVAASLLVIVFLIGSCASDESFRPQMEAPLPEGFPGPGQVGQVSVKEYPGYRMARTPMTADGQSAPFNVLYDHIQGRDIPMTGPVEMGYRADSAGPATAPAAQGVAGPAAAARPVSMAFLYPSMATGRTGSEGKVEVVDVPAMTVVSIGLRGRYTVERMEEGLASLRVWLTENRDRWRAAGDPRFMGYNSPFVLPWNRFGEVQVPIQRAGAPPPAAAQTRPAREAG